MHISLPAERHTLVTSVVVVVVECKASLMRRIASADKSRLVRAVIAVVRNGYMRKIFEVCRAVAVVFVLFFAYVPIVYADIERIMVYPEVFVFETGKRS